MCGRQSGAHSSNRWAQHYFTTSLCWQKKWKNQWYHCRGWQSKVYFWINICIVFIFQVLYDPFSLFYVFLVLVYQKEIKILVYIQVHIVEYNLKLLTQNITCTHCKPSGMQTCMQTAGVKKREQLPTEKERGDPSSSSRALEKN